MSNMRDIARLAGVSLGTVSKALHDDPKIAVATREKVKAVARELDYDLSFRSFARSTDGRLIGYLTHPSFGQAALDVLRGAMAQARQSKYGLVVMEAPISPIWIVESMRHLVEQGISGMIMAHGFDRLSRKVITNFVHSRGVHIVQVLHKIFPQPLDTICRNEHEYARAAADHLFSFGHRRVLGLELFEPMTWQRAFRSRGMEIAIMPTRARHIEPLRQACTDILHSDAPPTAIITSYVEDAYRLYNMLRFEGLAVPEDISIMNVGYYSGNDIYPEITAIDMNTREMGRQGVCLLDERIQSGIPPQDITDYRNIVLPAILFPRSSTGPAKKVDDP